VQIVNLADDWLALVLSRVPESNVSDNTHNIVVTLFD